MAFDSILLILVPEDNPGVGAPPDGAGGLVHPVTFDALDFVPVKSKNRSSHSTSRVGVWKRPAASRSPGPQADSGPIEQDKSGWCGPRPGPICQALLVVGTAAGASHVLTPTSLTLLPEEITTDAHCQNQPEVISTGSQGAERNRKRPK